MVVTPLKHTPYDGTSKPFTIGLMQLQEDGWLEEDQNLVAYIDEKLSLYKSLPDKVLVEDEGTREAQNEVLAVVRDHLLKHYPSLYQYTDDVMTVAGERRIALSDESLSPIARSALLVQEDLVLMRKSAEGWKLCAASLCFPSAWSLLEKFRRPLNEIHAPVPGFGAGTRNAGLIERMFDNLGPERLVLRWNWSVHGDGALYHPYSNLGPGPRFGEGDMRGHVWLRLERQTLRKLPKSGDILFTIRIHLNPVEMLEGHPNGPQLAQSLNEQLAGLTADEADYKGIKAERARLASRLQEIATGTRRP